MNTEFWVGTALLLPIPLLIAAVCGPLISRAAHREVEADRNPAFIALFVVPMAVVMLGTTLWGAIMVFHSLLTFP